MKKILMIILCLLCLSGCKADYLIEDVESYLDGLDIDNYELIVKKEYNDEFKFAIYNAGEDNQIYLTCRIVEEKGLFHEVFSGQSGLVYTNESITDYDFPSKYTDCKGSYYIGITYEEVEEVYYNDIPMDIHQQKVKVGQQEKTMTYWVYEYSDGEVDVDLIEYVYKN